MAAVQGDPVIGRLADSGMQLEVLPMTLTTWEQWQLEHPDTTVLDIHTGVYPALLIRRNMTRFRPITTTVPSLTPCSQCGNAATFSAEAAGAWLGSRG